MRCEKIDWTRCDKLKWKRGTKKRFGCHCNSGSCKSGNSVQKLFFFLEMQLFEERLETLKAQFKNAKVEAVKEFPKEQELAEKTGNDKKAVLGNQYRLYNGLAKLRADSHICCCEKWVYYYKNERVIEMSIATEGYSDLVKRIEDGFMEIDVEYGADFNAH